jgi:hypothetical protein
MPFKRHVVALFFFLIMSLLALYWPLLHATTHTGGYWTTDYYHFHWNFWWFRHALTTPGLNLYETNFVLFPAATNLAYHTLTLFWYPLWALLEPLVGTLVAMNVIFVASMTLTGYAAWLLLRRENVPSGLALAGAAAYMLTPAMLLSVMLTNINYLSMFWLPVQILIWGQITRNIHQPKRALIWALIQGIALYGMMMTDYTFLLFCVFLLVPYALLTLFEARTWANRVQLVAFGVLALAIMAMLLWFAGPLPHILTFDRSGLSPQPLKDAQSIPFPEGYFSRFATYDRKVTLGWFVLPVTLFSLIASLTILRRRIRDSRRWFWIALVILPLILSAGGSIIIAGAEVTMPFTAMFNLLGGMFRVPSRFGGLLILPAMIFVGRTWGPLLIHSRLLKITVSTFVIFAVVAEAQLFVPMPIQPVTQPYDFYETMGQERGEPYDDYAVVEVPVAGGSGEAWVGEFRPMETQFYGMTHGKRMLNGSIARAPLANFWYWLYDDPMLAWLGQRRYLEPENIENQLRERIFEWPIGYVVIHQDTIGRVGPTNQEIVGYFNTLPDLLCPVFVEGDAVAYRTAWHPDGCPERIPPEIEPGLYQIDIGSVGDEKFIGWGWHGPENIAGISVRWNGEYPQTQSYVDLPFGGYEISLSAQAFNEPRTLRVLVNDTPLDEPVSVSTESLQTFTFTLPAEIVGDGQQLNLTLDYDGWVVPNDVNQGGDMRKLALMVDWIRFQRIADS